MKGGEKRTCLPTKKGKESYLRKRKITCKGNQGEEFSRLESREKKRGKKRKLIGRGGGREDRLLRGN